MQLLNAYFLMSSLLRFMNNLGGLLEYPLYTTTVNFEKQWFINFIYSIYDLKSLYQITSNSSRS